MGLPMYREPSPTGSKPSPTKSDTSAQARSSIRRQQDVARHQFLRQQAILRHRLVHHPNAPRISVTQYDNVDDLRPRDMNRDAQSSRRQTRSPDFALLDLRHGSSSLADSARREAGQQLLRDVLRQGHPSRHMRIPRESTVRLEMLTSPWSNDDSALTSPHLGSARDSDGSANEPSPNVDQWLPFTPRFAPAFAFHNDVSSQNPTDRPLSPYPRPDATLSNDGSNRRNRSLRRIGNRSVNDFSPVGRVRPPFTIDGLGDRQRSFSPADDDADQNNHEYDTWDTLLTTITPDATLPSADSSFTSTAASASASHNVGRSSRSSNSSSSQRSSNSTALTRPSSRASPVNPNVNTTFDPYPDYLHPCDSPLLASDDDTEPESDLDRRVSSTVSSFRSRRPRLYDNGAAFRSNPRISSGRPHVDSTGEISSLQDSQLPIPSTSTSTSTSTRSSFQDNIDADMEEMQNILNYLARRDDIPEEWWQQVGLSRTIRSRRHEATPRLN